MSLNLKQYLSKFLNIFLQIALATLLLAKCIHSTPLKQDVFVQISQYISLNLKQYLSKFLNIYLQIALATLLPLCQLHSLHHNSCMICQLHWDQLHHEVALHCLVNALQEKLEKGKSGLFKRGKICGRNIETGKSKKIYEWLVKGKSFGTENALVSDVKIL